MRSLTALWAIGYPPAEERRLITALDAIRLEVHDLDRSMAFYVDGLRFELAEPPGGSPPQAAVRAGGVTVVLCEVPSARGRRAAGAGFRLDVLSLDAYQQALLARGVRTSPSADDHGGRQFLVRDPDGYVWQFREAPA